MIRDYQPLVSLNKGAMIPCICLRWCFCFLKWDASPMKNPPFLGEYICHFFPTTKLTQIEGFFWWNRSQFKNESPFKGHSKQGTVLRSSSLLPWQIPHNGCTSVHTGQGIRRKPYSTTPERSPVPKAAGCFFRGEDLSSVEIRGPSVSLQNNAWKLTLVSGWG